MSVTSTIQWAAREGEPNFDPISNLDSGSSSKVARLGGEGLASMAENGRSPNDPVRADAFPI